MLCRYSSVLAGKSRHYGESDSPRHGEWDHEGFERLRAELTQAYATPESSYEPLTAKDVVARNRYRFHADYFGA